MRLTWHLLIPLSLVSSATYEFAWDARQLNYTCDGLMQQTGKEWAINGDFCVHFSDDRYSWSGATDACKQPSFSSSTALAELSWLRLRLLPTSTDESTRRYWTALKFMDAESLLDGPISTSIYNPSWADAEPTSLADACVAIDLSSTATKQRGWYFEQCNSELPVICQTFACIDDEFRCADNTRCIPRAAVNDGFEDCLDGSDESSSSQQSFAAASQNLSRAVRLSDIATPVISLTTLSAPRNDDIEFTCPFPQDLKQIEVTVFTGYEVGNTIKWKCNSGYAPRDEQESACVSGEGWMPSIQCNKLNCFEPEPANLTQRTGTFHGDRAHYSTAASVINSELTRVAVCDEGTWVYMNDELDEVCLGTSFKFGHFSRDKYLDGETMEFTCEKDFYPALIPATCQASFYTPLCNPTPIGPSTCDGTVHQGPPQFERDWCACRDGGVKQDGECQGYTDGCSAEQDTCSVGKTCQRNETAGEDFHCACPAGKCLYPFDDCAQQAFLPTGSVDKDLGECATIRCQIDDLKLMVPTNCQITTYFNAKMEVDMRLGTTDVMCTHDAGGGEKVQTRHSIECVDGQWEGAEFNKVCNATKELNYLLEQYNPFETANVYYRSIPGVQMSIRCNGNGEWMGEVPTENCINGTLKKDGEVHVVRCMCDEGFYGTDCSSPCDHGYLKADGTCECNSGYLGDHCEIAVCPDVVPLKAADGDKISLVFIIDFYKQSFDQLITNKDTGLTSSLQQLIRDISYYDGQFISDIVLITFGMSTYPSDILTTKFDWAEVGDFVATLQNYAKSPPNFCTYGVSTVLSQVSKELEALPRGSIVNLLTVQPIEDVGDYIIDMFVPNGLIFNIITDSSYKVNSCASSGGSYSHYQRLAKLTGGYYLDGLSPASFSQIIPRLYKSSVVLIPAVTIGDATTIFPFAIDAGAQSMIVQSFGEDGAPKSFQIASLSSPHSVDVSSTKNCFRIEYNSPPDSSWLILSMLEGYYFQGLTIQQTWAGAKSSCETLGGTVADMDNICQAGAPTYWLPYRRSEDGKSWEASYRDATIPVIDTNFDPDPVDGYDCVALDCSGPDAKWIATSCTYTLDVMCQKPVFDAHKDASLPTDEINPAANWALYSSAPLDAKTSYSIRVQSTIAFDYMLTDKDDQALQINSGETRMRLSTATPSAMQDAMRSVVIEDSAITRSPKQQTACVTFPTSTIPLFCRESGDVTVQVLNSDGATMRSFVARCTSSDSPEYRPPVDCASTGCIMENTGFCFIDQSNMMKCSCLKGFSGAFCEYQEEAEASCPHYAEVNDVSTNSVIMQSGCGCTADMTTCSYNRDDACDNKCSSDSTCQFIDMPADAPDPTPTTATPPPLSPKAVAACVCEPRFEGEFCDRPVANDCTGKPCHNGAECIDTIAPNGIMCVCTAGYTGQFCDISMGLCTDFTCENGGTCFNLDPLSTFCMCHNGYAGDRCERMLNLGCFNDGRATANGDCDCRPQWEGQYCTLLKDPMPLIVCGCADGAQCVYDEGVGGVRQTSCKCGDNHVGDKCEVLQSPCALSPCGPHGNCTDGANAREYKCDCDDDYAGDLCDVFVGGPGCDEDTCLNGGTCDKGVCECPSTFTGTHCQTSVPCKGANGDEYCMNKGTCSEVNDKPVCQCPIAYTGKQCEKETTKTFNIKFGPATQQLLFDMQNVDPIFTVCAWVRGTPPRATADTEMPIFEIEFGSDKLRVTTKKATVRGQSLGPLDLRMQVWQQFCVRCNNVKCDAFANGASLGVNLFGGFTHSSKTLTIAPAPAKGETMLNAEISRFSIYNRAISDKEVADFTFDCASTVGKDSTVEYVWWEILDAVKPPSALVSPGLCETSTCFPGTCKESNDKSPPVATSCPEHMHLTSSRPKSISWSEPAFEDDQAVISVDSNYRSGDIFVWGEHHVVYTALDASSNVGRCEFDIFLAPNDCKAPVPPRKGDVQVKDTFDGESGSYSAATVQCEDPRFPQDGPKFYVCDYLGQWRRSYYSPTFMPPSCGRVSEPDQTMDGYVHFAAAGFNCEENRQKIRDTIDHVLSPVCPEGEDGCAIVTISDCPKKTANRGRADEEVPTLSYTITLVNDEDPLIYQNVQSELEKVDGVADVAIEPPVLTCSADTPLKFDSGGETLCSEVPQGYYFSNAAKFACPINQYQDESNKDACKNCPDATITESEGATKTSDCYENCSPGQWCNFDTGLGVNGAFDHCCQDCAKGSYESGTGSLQCTSCKDGMTTPGTGSKKADDCFWPCTFGQEVNADATTDKDVCRDCERGKYKDTNTAGQCRSCASGLTTDGTASTKASDCSVLYCPPNTYVNPSAKGSTSIDPTTFKLADYCLPCEKGTWQEKYNSTSCTACPNTPDINTPDFPATCRLENECSPDLANCGEGLKCIKWPDNNYYHCVDNHDEQQSGGSSLVWWQIVLIVAGCCLGVAIIVAIAVIVAMRCFNVGKKVEKDTDSLSHQRRATIDNYGSTVPDKEETHYDDLPTPMLEMPPVHVDSAYVYNKTLPVPPNTPAAPQLPIEYYRQAPVIPTTAVVRMRKRMSNASANRQSRPFSTDTIGSIPSIRDPAGRSSGNFFVPSVTLRSNSESSLDSFSVGSVSSRQFDQQPRQRPDSTQIVHALIDALDEDRFRGGWDRESSIL